MSNQVPIFPRMDTSDNVLEWLKVRSVARLFLKDDIKLKTKIICINNKSEFMDYIDENKTNNDELQELNRIVMQNLNNVNNMENQGFKTLSDEIITNIFAYLDREQIQEIKRTCIQFAIAGLDEMRKVDNVGLLNCNAKNLRIYEDQYIYHRYPTHYDTKKIFELWSIYYQIPLEYLLVLQTRLPDFKDIDLEKLLILTYYSDEDLYKHAYIKCPIKCCLFDCRKVFYIDETDTLQTTQDLPRKKNINENHSFMMVAFTDNQQRDRYLFTAVFKGSMTVYRIKQYLRKNIRGLIKNKTIAKLFKQKYYVLSDTISLLINEDEIKESAYIKVSLQNEEQTVTRKSFYW